MDGGNGRQNCRGTVLSQVVLQGKLKYVSCRSCWNKDKHIAGSKGAMRECGGETVKQMCLNALPAVAEG